MCLAYIGIISYRTVGPWKTQYRWTAGYGIGLVGTGRWKSGYTDDRSLTISLDWSVRRCRNNEEKNGKEKYGRLSRGWNADAMKSGWMKCGLDARRRGLVIYICHVIVSHDEFDWVWVWSYHVWYYRAMIWCDGIICVMRWFDLMRWFHAWFDLMIWSDENTCDGNCILVWFYVVITHDKRILLCSYVVWYCVLYSFRAMI